MSEKLGKIDRDFFKQLILTKLGRKRSEVSVAAQFGLDVSVIDLPGEMAMALTSDPLSLIPSLGLEESAWLSVQLMANDMATTGFAPMYGQFVLNLPAGFSKSDFKIYWDYIHQFCDDIGVAITGGHTGFIEGQNSTIAGGGTLLTIAPKNKILVSKFAQPGDSILITKTCAISSAAILALSFPETVKNKLGCEIYNDAASMFYHISSLKDALTAAGKDREHPEITSMHDVTEGGVLGAIFELATASGNGAKVYADKLPIGRAQEEICSLFSLDPRYCVGAGSMIISCKKESADAVIARLKNEGILCSDVGEITEETEGIKIIKDEVEHDIIYFEDDPYWAAFFKAIKKGWK